MRAALTLCLCITLATCAAPAPSSRAERLATLEQQLAAAPPRSTTRSAERRFIDYDLAFALASPDPNEPPTIFNEGVLTVESDASTGAVLSAICQLRCSRRGSIATDGPQLPRFDGACTLDTASMPDKWITSFNPMAIDNELRFELPPLTPDTSLAEGAWSFSSIAGPTASGPVYIRDARLPHCPGILYGPDQP